jgi:RNA polymerase sigma factor (sigma-70 family)
MVPGACAPGALHAARHNPCSRGASPAVKAKVVSTRSGVRGERGTATADPFERLFLAEYGRVVAIAHRVLAERSEAEDVAQEVFLDFHRRHDPEADFAAPWLHRAATHTALNRIRSRRRRQRRELASADLQRDAPDPQQVVEVMEDRRRVRDALRRLPRKAASVLTLRYSGLSYVEVGAALGVSTGQIGTLLRRAEQALRKEMNDNATPQ